MKTLCLSLALGLLLGAGGRCSNDAPAAFDGASNGLVDQATHDADRDAFEEVETVADGLGPVYNAQSCRECHQNPASGGPSQIAELRAGHRDPQGRFVNPSVPIADGKAMITGRTLINDRAICPSAAFPDQEIQERVPDTETVRTFRTSVNLLGDGFVEAVADETLKEIADRQCRETHGRVCGKVVSVPVLEAPGKTRIGRFGWKDQQASLLSFAGDAYLNEMGVTSRLLPDEITTLCDAVKDPEDAQDSDGLADIDRFARFIRATKAPPRDAALAQTEDAKKGADLFVSIGCERCHVSRLETAPTGTEINGGTFTVPEALGGKSFHPFSDFLLHDVGTGDGIAVAVQEHFGARYLETQSALEMQSTFNLNANRLRTPPLWGVRTHSRLMHDGESLTLRDAIRRHRGEAAEESRSFLRLPPEEQERLLTFLLSL
jgi:CxxC motif-containing protein (DUF1111 family)